MNMMLKTCLFVAAVAAIYAAPAKADPISNYQCMEEYRFCLAAGYDADMCRDNYWLCRYGYIPYRMTGMPSMAGNRR